jgi:hypothetical protein
VNGLVLVENLVDSVVAIIYVESGLAIVVASNWCCCCLLDLSSYCLSITWFSDNLHSI